MVEVREKRRKVEVVGIVLEGMFEGRVCFEGWVRRRVDGKWQ